LKTKSVSCRHRSNGPGSPPDRTHADPEVPADVLGALEGEIPCWEAA